MDLFSFLIGLFLGTRFLLSAPTKLVTPRQFAQDVQNYGMLPSTMATMCAWVLPYLELGVAALLLSGFLVTWGALVAIGMLVTFMIAVGSAMVRGLNLSCSCFGILYREG